MKSLLTTLLLLTLLVTKATHNRAGEILYKRVPPYFSGTGTSTVAVYNYSITLIMYTDDGSGIADRCVDTLYFGDGSKGGVPRINGTTGSCLCSSTIPCGVLIVNTPGYRVKQNIYSVTHTYDNPGSYTVRFSDFNRNSGSLNIPNSGSEAFSIKATILINSSWAYNSSPVLTNLPVDQATVGLCFYHNLGATDADGDSISYSPQFCLGNNGFPISGYQYPGFGGQTYTFSAAGVLTWCVPPLIGEYNLAVTIKEWRKNSSGIYQVIGYIMRDMQVLVKNNGSVGIGENDLSEDIRIYPNPFHEEIQLDLGANYSGKAESYIYTVAGKLISSYSTEKVNCQSLDLQVNALDQGIYLLEIKLESGVLRKKIVKE
jgi:hypothetical protein